MCWYRLRIFILVWSCMLLVCVYFCMLFGAVAAFSRNMSPVRVDRDGRVHDAFGCIRANNRTTCSSLLFIFLHSIPINTQKIFLWYCLFWYRHYFQALCQCHSLKLGFNAIFYFSWSHFVISGGYGNVTIRLFWFWIDEGML